MHSRDLSIAQAAVLMEKSRPQTWRILTFYNMEHPEWQLLRRPLGARAYRVNPVAFRIILRGDADVALELLSERVGNLEADCGSLAIRTCKLEKRQIQQCGA
jgi:hypothetical protein